MSRYIITGNLSSRQNISSISSWLREYASVLRDIDPGMSLTLAGKNPHQEILEEALKTGAAVIPSPENMSALIENADVYICPADNGGGIKLRVMDGLRFGLPVVAHVLASRGYEPFIGKSLYLYEDEASFRLAVDSARKASLNKSLLIDLYRSIFSFESGVARLGKILVNL